MAVFSRTDIRPDVQENILHWFWLHNASVIGFFAGFDKHREAGANLSDMNLVRERILAI